MGPAGPAPGWYPRRRGVIRGGPCHRSDPLGGWAEAMSENKAFLITGPDALLRAGIVALLSEMFPDHSLTTGVGAPEHAYPGVTVECTATRQWVHVSQTREGTQDLVRALAAGASAVMTLDHGPEEFRRAIGEIVQPGRSADSSHSVLRWMAQKTMSVLESPAQAAPGSVALTSRERMVLRHLAEGLSTAEVAVELSVSPNTVRSHIRSMSVKFDVSGRTRLLAAARALGFSEAFATTGGDRRAAV
jgi:DNA-binding NarL/FixJ family response regulator